MLTPEGTPAPPWQGPTPTPAPPWQGPAPWPAKAFAGYPRVWEGKAWWGGRGGLQSCGVCVWVGFGQAGMGVQGNEPPPPRFRLCAPVNQTLGRERGGHRRCLPEGRTIWVNGSLRIGWKNGCLPELALGHMGEPVWAWPFFSQRKMGMSGLAHVHIGSR